MTPSQIRRQFRRLADEPMTQTAQAILADLEISLAMLAEKRNSRRDAFARAALGGVLVAEGAQFFGKPEKLAATAYAIGDAMMEHGREELTVFESMVGDFTLALAEHDEALKARKHGGAAAGEFVDRAREILGVGK